MLTSDGERAGGALGGRARISGHHPQLVLGDALSVQLGGGDHHTTAAVDEEVHAGHAHLHAVGHQPVQALIQVDGHHLREGRGRMRSGDTRTGAVPLRSAPYSSQTHLLPPNSRASGQAIAPNAPCQVFSKGQHVGTKGAQ